MLLIKTSEQFIPLFSFLKPLCDCHYSTSQIYCILKNIYFQSNETSIITYRLSQCKINVTYPAVQGTRLGEAPKNQNKGLSVIFFCILLPFWCLYPQWAIHISKQRTIWNFITSLSPSHYYYETQKINPCNTIMYIINALILLVNDLATKMLF